MAGKLLCALQAVRDASPGQAVVGPAGPAQQQLADRMPEAASTAAYHDLTKRCQDSLQSQPTTLSFASQDADVEPWQKTIRAEAEGAACCLCVVDTCSPCL